MSAARHGEHKPSLSALAARLGVAQGGDSSSSIAESRSLDEVMDDFIEEHSQSYEFRDCQQDLHRSDEDRYVQIFNALQKELCRMAGQPSNRRVSCSPARTLRVLQCLRLLTRDQHLQLDFFERAQACAILGGRERDRERARGSDPCDRAPLTERGRDRTTAILPPPAPATSSRAPVHPFAGARPGVSASPRRNKWRSPEPRMHCARGHSAEELGYVTSDAERGDRGVRLPPLDTPRGGSYPSRSHVVMPTTPPSAESSIDSTAALLRFLGEFVTVYLSESRGCENRSSSSRRTLDMQHAADASAGAGMDARLGLTVAGYCVNEIVGMLNRYASTEARQSRLAQLGALRPLVSLLNGLNRIQDDLLLLRCALETLVHFTTHRSNVVLAELVSLSKPTTGTRVFPHGSTASSTSLLLQCLELLNVGESTYEGLAGQLLEQLLESPDFRMQLRDFGAIPTIIAFLKVPAGVQQAVNSDTPRKAIRLLRCCQILARDYVELGDAMAVQVLREHGAIDKILHLLGHCQQDLRESDVAVAALETLAQMCMDDECATILRTQHVGSLAVIATPLLNMSWRSAARIHGYTPENEAREIQLAQNVQCASARLLRFLFAVERNRKVFKRILTADTLASFVDIGNYVWPLHLYQPFVMLMNNLSDQDVEQLMRNFLLSSEPQRRFSGEERQSPNRRGNQQAAYPFQAASAQDMETATMVTDTTPRKGLSGGLSADHRARRRSVCGYTLIECVGAGAFGRVHLAARSDMPGHDFALKEVPLQSMSDSANGAPSETLAQNGRPSRCSTPRGANEKMIPYVPGVEVDSSGDTTIGQDQVAKEISQEVKMLRQLDHPNVVRYYSSFSTGEEGASPDTLWIVMEYCGGVSLQNLVVSAHEKGRDKLPEHQTWHIFVQLCLALKYLHVEKGIAHRDLTPNNVIVQVNTLAVKVADFGLARQKLRTGTNTSSLMKSVVGTILYSCPELVQEKPYTNKTDVWALGCLLYKMATLRDPFQGGNPLTVARKIVECDYERLDDSQHSKMLIETCERCLCVAPDARPDIQEVCRLITPALVRHLEGAHRTIIEQQRQLQNFQQRSSTATASAALMCSNSTDTLDDSPPVKTPPWRREPADHHKHAVECQLSALSTLSEQSAHSARTSHSAQSGRSVRSPVPLPPPDHGPDKVQVPRRALRTVQDPFQKALAVVHQLAFLGKQSFTSLPSRDQTDQVYQKFLRAHRYQEWLLGDPSNVAVIKREVSRLMQRSHELVPVLELFAEDVFEYRELCTKGLSYEVLHDDITSLCIAFGYDAESSPSRPGTADEVEGRDG